MSFDDVVGGINSFLWDFLLLILLCGTGLYFTIKLRFVQVIRFKNVIKQTFGSIKLHGEKAGKEGMSSFQSLMTAVAAQVGTGNLAGAATAIVLGGPGAIFWMWISAFLGMATVFAEATAAQQYKTVLNGKIIGGPAYYIREAFQGKFGKILAVMFSAFLILALGFMGNMVQSNSISEALKEAFNMPPLVTGLIVAALSGFIFLGGVQRIASITEKVVPVMAICYIIGSVVVLILNAGQIPEAFRRIFVGAFNPEAIGGGILGVTIQKAVRYGVARGLFSNEAGMGSTPHAHAIARVKHPCEQGEVAMMGVFIDTFIVLTLTALVIITSGLQGGENLTGIVLTQGAFAASLGSFGDVFIAVCLLFFAFSTIIGWYFFGETNVRFLFGDKAVKIYAAAVCICVACGPLLDVTRVWSLADMCNGFMVIPNLLALLALSGGVAKAYRDYTNAKIKK